MERKIGEIFEFGGEWYQCIKGLGCNECDLSKITCYHRFESGSCSPNMRKDGTQVIFKKLEKVGEPYEHYGKLYQCYKLPVEIEIRLLPDNCYPVGKDNLVEIEIKQNKEDMKERELDPRMAKVIDEATQKMGEEIGRQIEANINKQRMKPFNLEAAKSGKPVCTRDGRKARIICFDAKFPKTGNIVTLVEKENGEEVTLYYYDDGHCSIGRGYDLMMLPEKKEGWVNIYHGQVYNTFEKAEEARKIAEHGGDNYLKTIKIDWEE